MTAGIGMLVLMGKATVLSVLRARTKAPTAFHTSCIMALSQRAPAIMVRASYTLAIIAVVLILGIFFLGLSEIMYEIAWQKAATIEDVHPAKRTIKPN
jgi:hypothetical protein